jgi:hypothetical protein
MSNDGIISHITREMSVQKFLILLAFVALGLSSRTDQVRAQAITCTGTLAPATYSSVLVPAGQSCMISTLTVLGNVIVTRGATLSFSCTAMQSTCQKGEACSNAVAFPRCSVVINGNIQAKNADNIDISGCPLSHPSTCESTIKVGGNVSLTGTTGAINLANLQIGGNLSLTETNSGIDLENLGIGGNLEIASSNPNVSNSIGVTSGQITGNVMFVNNYSGQNLLSGNNIGGNLICSSDSPPPTNAGKSNVVAGKEISQCAGL